MFSRAASHPPTYIVNPINLSYVNQIIRPAKEPRGAEKKFLLYSRDIFNFDAVQPIFFVACAFGYFFLVKKVSPICCLFLPANGITYHEFPLHRLLMAQPHTLIYVVNHPKRPLRVRTSPCTAHSQKKNPLVNARTHRQQVTISATPRRSRSPPPAAAITTVIS